MNQQEWDWLHAHPTSFTLKNVHVFKGHEGESCYEAILSFQGQNIASYQDNPYNGPFDYTESTFFQSLPDHHPIKQKFKQEVSGLAEVARASTEDERIACIFDDFSFQKEYFVQSLLFVHHANQTIQKAMKRGDIVYGASIHDQFRIFYEELPQCQKSIEFIKKTYPQAVFFNTDITSWPHHEPNFYCTRAMHQKMKKNQSIYFVPDPEQPTNALVLHEPYEKKNLDRILQDYPQAIILNEIHGHQQREALFVEKKVRLVLNGETFAINLLQSLKDSKSLQSLFKDEFTQIFGLAFHEAQGQEIIALTEILLDYKGKDFVLHGEIVDPHIKMIEDKLYDESWMNKKEIDQYVDIIGRQPFSVWLRSEWLKNKDEKTKKLKI